MQQAPDGAFALLSSEEMLLSLPPLLFEPELSLPFDPEFADEAPPTHMMQGKSEIPAQVAFVRAQ